jgi:hypothetical protein
MTMLFFACIQALTSLSITANHLSTFGSPPLAPWRPLPALVRGPLAGLRPLFDYEAAAGKATTIDTFIHAPKH